MAYLDDDYELTGLEEHLRDEGTREDYNREAYGDPCPCGTLRWGADCPNCYDFDAEDREASAQFDAASRVFDTVEAALKDAENRRLDDDIWF